MKKYPSPQDIEEMKARGYEASTIESAREQGKRWHLAQEIAAAIREAFAGVTLGDGVGLYQARGIDGYEDEKALAAYRLKDEQCDWSAIAPAALNECNSSLSFFDAEGMRFHLPAYLLADLAGTYLHGMAYCLARSSDLAREQFLLLSDAQRRAVTAYLQYIAEEEAYYFHRLEILRVIDEYWTR